MFKISFCWLYVIGSLRRECLRKESYTVGAGGTYRPFEYENSQNSSKALILTSLKQLQKQKVLTLNLSIPLGKEFLRPYRLVIEIF